MPRVRGCLFGVWAVGLVLLLCVAVLPTHPVVDALDDSEPGAGYSGHMRRGIQAAVFMLAIWLVVGEVLQLKQGMDYLVQLRTATELLIISYRSHVKCSEALAKLRTDVDLRLPAPGDTVDTRRKVN